MSKKNTIFKSELLILSTLSRDDYYGYTLAKEIKEGTSGLVEIKEGAMYPILYNLTKEGYISNYSVEHNRKIRVYYHIEEKGLAYLKELISDFEEMVTRINQVIYKK